MTSFPQIAIILVMVLGVSSFAYAEIPVPNPNTQDSLRYCPNGICSTGVVKPINHTKQVIAWTPETIGHVSLTPHCSTTVKCNPTVVTQLGKIGIQLSQACLTQLKGTGNSSCGVYNPLKQFDNTNPLWAGRWIETPYEHRLAPKIKNHEIANPNPWVVMVDPNSDFMVGAKSLIVTNLGEFIEQGEENSTLGGGAILNTHKGFWVSSDCSTAMANPDKVNQTLIFLEHGCTGHLGNNVTKVRTLTPFKTDTPMMVQNNFIKSLFNGHSFSGNHTTGGLGLGLCINGHTCNYTSPGKKW